MTEDKKLKDILSKYRNKVGEHIDLDSGDISSEDIKKFSSEYIKFKEEVLSVKRSSYEKWCNATEKLISFKPDKNKEKILQESIDAAHIDITPAGAASFAVFIGFIIILFGIIVSLVSYLVFNSIPFFTISLILIFGLIAVLKFTDIPIYMAARWRLKASNQMVICILYVVIYMRHTSNLEHAIKFAAEHIDAPLSFDLRKIFWDIETEKFSTIKESLDNYLETWRHHNLEFVTAFHLIESSLFEPTESRRIDLLEKGLNVILDGTYEKMLHYAQDLKGPITTLHMLGVILPILGLVIFPLIGSFLNGLVKWYHLALLYNIILPILVFYLGINILSKRPTGYGDSKVAKNVYKQSFNPFFICFFIAVLFLVIGLFPLLFQLTLPVAKESLGCVSGDIDIGSFGCFFGYVPFGKEYFGPFGIGALFLGFFIPAGLAIAMSVYFKLKTKNFIDIRNDTKNLESEFASALFQLGNRVGDGIPTELAFSKVSQTLEETPSGNFFRIVDTNIRQLGMGLKEAIFNEKNGAILSYPSSLIESSMEVLLESSRKGPSIVSQSMISIANYVDKIHQVSERLKDLLAEVISSMKSQINFLTPVIAGIVVGISVMIVNIIVVLNTSISKIASQNSGDLGTGGIEGLSGLFSINGIIPGYFFQLVVGLYVVEITYVLTVLQNGIENGNDKLNEQYLLSKNIMRSFLLYAVIALIVTLLFTGLASVVLQGSNIGLA